MKSRKSILEFEVIVFQIMAVIAGLPLIAIIIKLTYAAFFEHNPEGLVSGFAFMGLLTVLPFIVFHELILRAAFTEPLLKLERNQNAFKGKIAYLVVLLLFEWILIDGILPHGLRSIM